MLNSLILRIGKWPGQGLAVGETLAGPRSVPLSLGEHLVGLLCQLPCSFALFSLLSPSQGLLLDFCLQSSGEEPLTSPSVQGSSALTNPLLWLKRCKSGEVSVALSKCWTQPHFVKSKSVKSKQYKLHVWWQVACPDHLGIFPSGVKWILFHQPCVSCITFPQDGITLCSGGAWRRWSRSWSEVVQPTIHGLSVVVDTCEGFLDWCKFWLCISVFVFCLHALLQSSVTAAVDTSYAIASAGAD